MDDLAPSLEQIRGAHARVRAQVHRTPLLSSRLLSDSVSRPVRMKAEHLQKTGSFKARGALNVMLQLPDDARRRGVTTISAGNHAQAVAWAARRAGVPARVVMPESAPRSKVEASRSYGAEVILHGTVFEAFEHALGLAERDGLTFVHPFDDPDVLAGQGGVGLELVEDLPDLGTVVVPIGGGGLVGGVAAAVARLRPDVRLIGVEPEGATAMRRSLDRGSPVRLEEVDTIADGLGAPMAGERTYPLVERFVDDVVVVTDRAIARAVIFLLERTKQLVEPGGAAGIAALQEGLVAGGRDPVAVVLSGGNVDTASLPSILALASPDEAPS